MFFHEINKKGNDIVYNLFPNALVRISTRFKDISQEKFEIICKKLLSFIEKDKQLKAIVDKICQKLKKEKDSDMDMVNSSEI